VKTTPDRTLQRKHEQAQIRLKWLLMYDGDDVEIFTKSLVALTRICGYHVRSNHRQILRHQADMWISGRRRSLVLGFRGMGKSTVATVIMAIKMLLILPNVRMLFVSDSEGASREFIKEIVAHFRTNDTLFDLFGEVFPDQVKTRLRGERRKQTTGRTRESYAVSALRNNHTLREPTLLALGVRSQIASRHFDIIFADDLVTNTNSQTVRQRANLRAWHDSSMIGALMPHSAVFYTGTRYYPGDLYDDFEYGRDNEAEGALAGAVTKVPLVKNFDDPPEDWISAEPIRFPVDVCRKLYRDMGRYHFRAQMLQDTSEGSGELFKYGDFRWYGDALGADTSLPAMDTLVRWQASDLVARKTETGHFFATVTIGIHTQDGIVRIFVLDLERFRGGMRKQKNSILSSMKQWNPIRHGVEAVAAQAGFAEEIKEGTMLPVHLIERRGADGDKVLRAMRVSPNVEAHQVYFPQVGMPQHDRISPLINELTSFPKGDHDDTVDAFVDAITLAMYGGPEAAMIGDPDEADDEGLLAYDDEDGDDDEIWY